MPYISEPETEILGGPDLYVDLGSMINLTCVIRNTHNHPDKVSMCVSVKEREREID